MSYSAPWGDYDPCSWLSCLNLATNEKRITSAMVACA